MELLSQQLRKCCFFCLFVLIDITDFAEYFFVIKPSFIAEISSSSLGIYLCKSFESGARERRIDGGVGGGGGRGGEGLKDASFGLKGTSFSCCSILPISVYLHSPAEFIINRCFTVGLCSLELRHKGRHNVLSL